MRVVCTGYTANRITQKLHDNDVRIHVLPVLIQALLLANRFVRILAVNPQSTDVDYIRFLILLLAQ